MGNNDRSEFANLWDRILKHRPPFTREAFDRIIPIYRSVRQKPDESHIFTIENLLGDMIERRSYSVRDSQCDEGYTWRPIVVYESYQRLADSIEEHSQANDTPAYCCPIDITTACTPDCHHEKVDQEAEHWIQHWHNSASRKRILDAMRSVLKESEPITQIICFGLGMLGDPDGPHCRQAYEQHLLTCDIRNLVRSLNSTNPNVSVPTFVQDPAYCGRCAEIIRSLDLTIVEDPDGFLKVTKNTLVVTFSPNVPVRQIVTDLTFTDNGPAAMLCDQIKDDGTIYAGINNRERGPRGGILTPYSTDPSSPIVWDYKERCTEVVLDTVDVQPTEMTATVVAAETSTRHCVTAADVALYVKRRSGDTAK
jgi:hypothetical protein